jgi:beta-lactam-binding protein with PASTA domain
MNVIANTNRKNVGLAEELSQIQLATFANNSDKIIVPEVRGLSMRKTMVTLYEKGLKYKINGSGKVFWQYPKPGEAVNKGTVCEIGLK